MMPIISLIACVSKDSGIGYQGQLLWQIPDDMHFFRQTTAGHPVVMGGATFRSIGRPLPKRQNIVLSRQPIGDAVVTQFNDASDLERFIDQHSGEIFIIGGASLYQRFIMRADKIYLTEVDAIKPADTFFPTFDRGQFDTQVLQDGRFGEIDYQIKLYQRR